MRKARAWAAERALQIHGIVWDREDMSVIRGHHPPWVPEEFWHQLCDQVFFYNLCGLSILFVLYILNRWCFYRCGVIRVGLLGRGPVGPTVLRRMRVCRPGTLEVRSRLRCIETEW